MGFGATSTPQPLSPIRTASFGLDRLASGGKELKILHSNAHHPKPLPLGTKPRVTPAYGLQSRTAFLRKLRMMPVIEEPAQPCIASTTTVVPDENKLT